MDVNTMLLSTVSAISTIVVRLVVEDATGDVNVTDIMLQGGGISTVWSGHPSEIQWSFN